MSFDTTIDLGEIGEQTVTVKFDYQPAERTTRDDPGCPAEVSITSVKFRGIDIKPDLCREMITELEQEAFEHMASERWQQDEDRAESSYFDKEAA
jgi:hypothetical protein